MRGRKRKPQPAPEEAERVCDVDDCNEPGLFKAPREGKPIRSDYYLFCLDHVREFNKNYNFFDGMDDDMVQHFMKDAVTGHRPTWKLGEGPSWNELDLEAEVLRYFGGKPVTKEQLQLPAEVQAALLLLDVEHPITPPALKKHYKSLAKLYHPDVSKEENAEALFKDMTQAYMVLKAYYERESDTASTASQGK